MGQRTRSGVWLGVAALLVAACASAAPSAAPTAAPLGFDIAPVKASLIEECTNPIIEDDLNPIIVDDLFCEQVNIAGMTADAVGLDVPTTLGPSDNARAIAICKALALAHDNYPEPLDYNYIGIKDKNGGYLAACSVN